MCGLIGIIGHNVEEELLNGLRLLQYRGYDSYGLCVINDHKLDVCKEIGHIQDKFFGLSGDIGIAHTRWATHGRVTLMNTHPIWRKNIALVQNGVIHNHNDIRKLFPDFHFEGETDTESILPLLIDNHRINLAGLKRIINMLEGSFAIVILNALKEEIYFMKKGLNPLAVGIKDGKRVIGSDIKLFDQFDKIIDIQDMQCGVLSRKDLIIWPEKTVYTIRTSQNVSPIKSKSSWFETEFTDQVSILRNSFKANVTYPAFYPDNVSLTGCGSAYLVGAVAQYWLREIAKIPSSVHFASELPVLNSCIVAISQSGETADTLLALSSSEAHLKIGFINNEHSTIRKHVDYLIPTLAKEEVSVASTKATTGQMLSLLRWALYLGDIDISEQIEDMFDLMSEFVKTRLPEIDQIAKLCVNQTSLFILGRGILYPIACECALKIKELAYIHAEGMSSSELKHGPLAVIDESSIVICFAPDNEITVSEIESRGGKVIVFTANPGAFLNSTIVQMPTITPHLSPFLYILPAQWLAYSLARLKGNNVDMPRNLAKSVTV